MWHFYSPIVLYGTAAKWRRQKLSFKRINPGMIVYKTTLKFYQTPNELIKEPSIKSTLRVLEKSI